jgi:hypothetical protein
MINYLEGDGYPTILDTHVVIEKKAVRVKYLDKEDIESLGLKIAKIYSSEIYSSDFDAQLIIDNYNFYELSYESEENLLIIEKFYQTKMCASTPYKKRPDLYSSETLFRGIIKNKSELKKLMQMLNIQQVK